MAQQHPPFPKTPAQGADAKFIVPLVALEADAAYSRVLGLLTTQYRRGRYQESNGTKALTQALSALSEKASYHYRLAQGHGHLLLCWHGTNATEVPFGRGAA